MKKQILREYNQDLSNDILNWAINYAEKECHINAMQLLYEYYYEDNDEALFEVADEYANANNYNIDDVYEATRMAAIYYFNYNPDYDREKITNESKKSKNLDEAINKIIKKVLSEKKFSNNLDKLIEQTINNNLKLLIESGKEKTNKKRSVIQWLQKPEVDTAEIRRKLEGEPESQEEEDSKRSYFMKKVNQSYGKDFTDKEVNDLYALKSSLGQ